MATWRELISIEMEDRGEDWDEVVGVSTKAGKGGGVVAANRGDLDVDFDSGFGSAEGCPFTLWTERRVYFPACYDGAEWVASVPRDPCGEPTVHVGGG